MNSIFFGTPKEVIPVLEALTKQSDVVTIVTTPDQKAGRKQLLTPSPVKAFAEKHSIPVMTPQQWDNEIKEQLQKMKPDLFLVAAYGKIIPNSILQIPKSGAINIHPSLLPKYRGPTPIQTAILNRDKETGITFIKMDEQMDHGPIIQQTPVALNQTDTFDGLMQRMFTQAAALLPDVINNYLSGEYKPVPQDDSSATYSEIVKKEDGYIDLTTPPDPDKLDRMIRAYYPWPTVWTKTNINNKEVRIKFLPNKTLQVEGKNPVSTKDFLNGYPEMKQTLEKINFS